MCQTLSFGMLSLSADKTKEECKEPFLPPAIANAAVSLHSYIVLVLTSTACYVFCLTSCPYLPEYAYKYMRIGTPLVKPDS
jgi:hypothetical protein